MKYFLLFFSFGLISYLPAQWSSLTNSVPTFSSPRAADLNGDGILDIVIGAGTDSTYSNYGVLAFNGLDGSSLWTTPAYDEVFSSAIFNDINNDNVPDVFIGGRNSQFFALNGLDGSIIWEAFPQGLGLNPADSGWYNFYSGQLIPDQNADMVKDILVTNGGDHGANPWDPRPTGHLMVLSGATGSVLAIAPMPDSNETYCSPVIADIQNTGNLQIVFGSGGENHSGSMWLANLSDLMNNNLSNSIQLATNLAKGFIAPASLADFDNNGYLDIIVQSYAGKIMRFDGVSHVQKWSVSIPYSESSAAPVIGNFFGGDLTPDIFSVCNQGVAPSFFDHYQVMIDGETGNIEWMDSISDLHFASANAFDSNNDGRDEVLISVNNINSYFEHELLLIDFENDNVTAITSPVGGVNLASTPLVTDLDNDNLIDIVYVYRADSTNPSAWNGIYVNRLNTSYSIANSGIAWGAYMGNNYNGLYSNQLVDCGAASVISSISLINPSCNGFSDGLATVNLIAPGVEHTYLWSNGSLNDSLINTGSGAYKLIVTNSSGCYELVSVLFNDPYVISFGNVIDNICPGDNIGSATLSSSGCPCMFSGCIFDWENGDSTKTANGLTAGMWSVAITHLDGCVVVDSVEILEGPPVIDSSFVNDQSCYNIVDGSIVLYPSDTVFTTYSWGNGSIASSLSNLPEGDYAVSVDNLNCYDSLFFTVQSPDSIFISLNYQDLLCYNDSSGQFIINSYGGYPIELYNLDNVFYSTNQFNNLVAGNYTVFTEDSLGCYSDTLDVIINQPDSIELSFTTTPETISLDGSIEVSTVGGTGSFSYLWSNGLTNAIIIDLESGFYSVSVTDANGCTVSDSVFVGSVVSVVNSTNNQVDLFPNPARNYFMLETNSAAGFSVRIFNVLGSEVYLSENNFNTKKINIENFPKGIFQVVVNIKSEFSIFTLIVN